MSVISKTAETNAVRTFYVTALAGPRIDKTRVAKGDPVRMSEHQARALLASGALVDDEAKVDDPFGEKAAAAERQAAADKLAAEQKAAEDRAAAEAAAAQKQAEAEAARKAAEELGGHADGDHPLDPVDHHDADDHPAG